MCVRVCVCVLALIFNYFYYKRRVFFRWMIVSQLASCLANYILLLVGRVGRDSRCCPGLLILTNCPHYDSVDRHHNKRAHKLGVSEVSAGCGGGGGVAVASAETQ